jgi:phosphoribosylglycinamide formyltransferase-1
LKDSFIETISLSNPINAVLLASGRGSNAKALLEYCRSEENLKSQNPWNICLIITDNPNAGIISIAKDFGVHCEVVEYPKGTKENAVERREQYSASLIKTLKINEAEITFAICAGFMKILTSSFLDYFKESHIELSRVINIHPSLLPSFPGAHAYEDAFAYGVAVSGATTHFVDEKIDNGPIIAQSIFNRSPSDTLGSFKAKGLSQEHPLFVKTLKIIQNNKLRFIEQPQNSRLVVQIIEDENEN